MHETGRFVTAEELERRPDLRRFELLEGRLVEMSPVGFDHGRVVVQLGSLRPGEMRAKIDEYLTRGVPLVVIVDPDERMVTLHPSGAPETTLRDRDEVFDLSLVIDGFRCHVEEIFE